MVNEEAVSPHQADFSPQLSAVSSHRQQLAICHECSRCHPERSIRAVCGCGSKDLYLREIWFAAGRTLASLSGIAIAPTLVQPTCFAEP